MDFDEAFEILIGHEGALSMNPNDRGNWTGGKVGIGQMKGTKYGVSAMSYPHLDIANLTLDDAKSIYRTDFWAESGAHLVPEAMRFDMFDAAVNSGPGRAARFLQRAVGVAQDGDIGPKTKAAINDMFHQPLRMLARFNGARLDFLNNNRDQWEEFGRGWAQRIAENLLRA